MRLDWTSIILKLIDLLKSSELEISSPLFRGRASGFIAILGFIAVILIMISNR